MGAKRLKRDTGQVGIGTLIVFIALVVVAAIAAGVLIATAGFLQSTSGETGQQSSSQVADRLQVVNAVGSVDQSTQRITRINLTVTKAPGADDVVLDRTTLEYVDDDQVVTLVHSGAGKGAGADGSVATYEIVDPDGSVSNDNVLNDLDDRATIQIDQTETAFESQLGEGEDATIVLVTQAGGKTTVTVSVPESLSQKSAVTL